MELPQVDLEQLRGLMKLMEQFDCDEIDLRDGGKRLHLQRNRGQKGGGPAVVMPTMLQGGAAAPAAAVAGGEAGPDALPEGVQVVRSPMVGTFYRAPSPEAGSFVEEGQKVGEDTVLCIIEAMKVMNEIKSDVSGQVVKILVENGAAVEYGEPLFHIQTAG